MQIHFNMASMIDMTQDIDTKLGEALQDTLDDFAARYELITDKPEFERIDHVAYDGFIPHTDGGYSTLLLFRPTSDTTHCPRVFQDYIARCTANCEADFYAEQTGETGSKAEVREYTDKLLDTDTGLEEDKEQFYTYHDAYMNECVPALEITVYYYGVNNDRHPDNGGLGSGAVHDTVLVQLLVNEDAPYYRSTKAVLITQPRYFPVNSNTPNDVAAYLKELLNAI